MKNNHHRHDIEIAAFILVYLILLVAQLLGDRKCYVFVDNRANVILSCCDLVENVLLETPGDSFKNVTLNC